MVKYTYPYGPNPEEESLKWRAKLASQPPRPPEECGHLIKDPAIERFGWIRENPDIYFKLKPRSVRYAIISLLLIPGAILLYAKKCEQWRDIEEGKPPRPLF